MKDKIREEFERSDSVTLEESDYFNEYGLYASRLLQNDFEYFTDGYKSRDAEIEELKQIQTDATIVIVTQQAEIKKLRESLSQMCDITESYLEADSGQEKQFSALFVALGLLKDGEE